MLTIEVAYALADKQLIIELQAVSPCTVEQAILQSEIMLQFPEIDLKKNKVGIFSEICPLSKLLRENDRVEIYRDLAMNPMDARRLRAIKQKQ